MIIIDVEYFHRIGRFLECKRTELSDILISISSYEAAADEIYRSIRTLHGVEKERKYLEKARTLCRLSVMQPSNVLLYSYVLYGIIPGIKFDEVFFKCSAKVSDAAKEIHALISSHFPLNIQLGYMSHEGFQQHLIPTSDVLIHTGAYSNAIELEKRLEKDQLFLFFGSGINPFIVGQKADLTAAVEGSLKARLFNSGQDCLCSNIFFVHESVLGQYIQKLRERLALLHVGDRTNRSARVNPLFYQLEEKVLHLFESEKYEQVYGKEMDLKKRVVPPTIILHEDISTAVNIEFFCPVFYIVPYRTMEEIVAYLGKQGNVEHAMATSIYGERPLARILQETHMIAHDKTIFDIEDGNIPFGGFGIKAGHVYYKGQRTARPLLVSKELYLASK